MTRIGRRLLLAGSAAAGLGIAAGILAVRRNADSARRVETARADYLAGRVQVVGGWIMADSEAAALSPAVPVPPSGQP